MATVKLNTKEFSAMLSKVSKCTSKGGMALLAELVEIRLAGGVLSLRTTDTRNVMILRKSGVSGDDFVATISIDVFDKIVSKTSKEEIELTVDDKAVHLKGNGSYHFPLIIEGDNPITFEPLSMISDPEVKKQFSKADFLEAIKYTGDFVGSAYVYPTVSGFYFGQNVITSDMCTCCYLHKQFFDSDVMFYPSTLALLNEVDEDTVMFLKKGRTIQFISSTCLINSTIHSDTENFPVADFGDYLTEEFGSSITISKKEACEILERVSFFVDMKTEFGATLFDFTEEGVNISDRNGKASERLSVKDVVNFVPFTCYVSAMDLLKVLNIEGDDEIRLWYANPTALRIESGNVTRILALLDPEDIETVNFDYSSTTDSQVEANTESANVSSESSMESEMDSIQW